MGIDSAGDPGMLLTQMPGLQLDLPPPCLHPARSPLPPRVRHETAFLVCDERAAPWGLGIVGLAGRGSTLDRRSVDLLYFAKTGIGNRFGWPDTNTLDEQAYPLSREDDS